MAYDDGNQLRVGNAQLGIIAFKAVMEDMAEQYGDSPDREAYDELPNRDRIRPERQNHERHR